MEDLLGQLEGAIALIQINAGTGISHLACNEQPVDAEGEVERDDIGESVAVQIGSGNGKGRECSSIALSIVDEWRSELAGSVAGKACDLRHAQRQSHHHVQLSIVVEVGNDKTLGIARHCKSKLRTEGTIPVTKQDG